MNQKKIKMLSKAEQLNQEILEDEDDDFDYEEDYSKSKQLRKNARLKQKDLKDKAYLSWFHNQGFTCMVCNNPQIEAHHVKLHSSDVKNDHELLPICEWHHKYSPEISPHGAPNRWRETYPIELQREYAQKLYNEYKGE